MVSKAASTGLIIAGLAAFLLLRGGGNKFTTPQFKMAPINVEAEEIEEILPDVTPKKPFIPLIAGSTRVRTPHEILALHSRSRRTTGGAFQFSQVQKLQFLGFSTQQAIATVNQARKSGDRSLQFLAGTSLQQLIKQTKDSL